MFNIDDKTLFLAAFTLVMLSDVLVLVAVIVLLRSIGHPQKPKTATGTSTHCGHCGNGLPPDPVRAISLGATTYMVYHCKTCKQETLLPTQ